jgi:hypothetical protein
MQLASTAISHSGPSDRRLGSISAVDSRLFFFTEHCSVFFAPNVPACKSMTGGAMFSGSNRQREEPLPTCASGRRHLRLTVGPQRLDQDICWRWSTRLEVHLTDIGPRTASDPLVGQQRVNCTRCEVLGRASRAGLIPHCPSPTPKSQPYPPPVLLLFLRKENLAAALPPCQPPRCRPAPPPARRHHALRCSGPHHRGTRCISASRGRSRGRSRGTGWWAPAPAPRPRAAGGTGAPRRASVAQGRGPGAMSSSASVLS